MKAEDLKQKYIDDLEGNFLPYWEKFIDEEDGGIFTCITNAGDEIVSERKYIWSQGRFLWLACHLIQLKEEGKIHLSPIWEGAIHKTYLLLRNHALLPNQHAVFAVEKNGGKIKDQMDKSIFADCFYVLGLNAYAHREKSREIFEHSFSVYQRIKKRIRSNEIPADPYPIPKGYRAHSIPMILMNVATELYETSKEFHFGKNAELLRDMEKYYSDIQQLKEGDRIREMHTGDLGSLLERHVNPGHMIECAWFMIDALFSMGEKDKKHQIHAIERAVKYALICGWDEKYGGLFRFVDKDGGKPQGKLIGTPYETLVLNTWDTKLWWPHSESLYTTLLLYILTGKEEWFLQYKKLEKYVFDIFPNENKEIGEWIQIRDRKGNPLNQVVALPVKDPFHIIRNYIKIIRLLEGSDLLATWDN